MDVLSLPRTVAVVLLMSSCLLAAAVPQNKAESTANQDQAAGSESKTGSPQAQNGPKKDQATPAETQEQPAPPPKPRPLSEDPTRQAWDLLNDAQHSDKASERVTSVRALSLMQNNRTALKLAEAALLDDKPEVRSSAESTLGELRFKSSIPKLRSMLEDKDPSVVLAAAHALEDMHDEAAYEVFYEILTGERKASKGLIADQTSILHDPKKLAKLGIEESISNVVPFGGFGIEAYRLMSKNEGARVRAAAARQLADDPDPASTKALTNAVGDDDWTVRASALEALAKRGDPTALGTVQLYMYDDKSEVKYNAAAATLHLLAIRDGRERKPKPRSRATRSRSSSH